MWTTSLQMVDQNGQLTANDDNEFTTLGHVIR